MGLGWVRQLRCGMAWSGKAWLGQSRRGLAGLVRWDALGSGTLMCGMVWQVWQVWYSPFSLLEAG